MTEPILLPPPNNHATWEEYVLYLAEMSVRAVGTPRPGDDPDPDGPPLDPELLVRALRGQYRLERAQAQGEGPFRSLIQALVNGVGTQPSQTASFAVHPVPAGTHAFQGPGIMLRLETVRGGIQELVRKDLLDHVVPQQYLELLAVEMLEKYSRLCGG